MNRTFALGDLALRIVLRFAQMFFDNAHAFDQHALFLRDDFKDFAGGTFEVSGDHFDLVAFLNVKLHPVHKTSGAKDTIVMKLHSRSSRASGPQMRVPRVCKSTSV